MRSHAVRLAKLEDALNPPPLFRPEDVLDDGQIHAALCNDAASRPALTAGQDAFLRQWVKTLLVRTALAGPMPVRGGRGRA